MNHLDQTHSRFFLYLPFLYLAFTLSTSDSASAYTVSDLKASYSNGQVFLTWIDPSVSNLQYNVYRSASKFTSPSQINAANYLGFVRDNSSKNIQLSQIEEQAIFYKITDNGQPLSNQEGLYVVTCTANQSWYYAVTVTNLSNDKEAKQIIDGENTLSTPVSETVVQPLPVFQDSVIVAGGEWKKRYVQFVNNQETALYPAMNSTGSYGFNFFIVKRGTALSYPLIVVFEGGVATVMGGVGLDQAITDCYILGVCDWLPIPSDDGKIGVGDNTYFCCYHEDFNIYSNENPIPESGIVKIYPQKRYREAIKWMKNQFPIDASRVYTKGVSASGFGALLMANLFPNEIAAAYATVEPMFVKPVGVQGGLYKQMWGSTVANLNSDAADPITQLPVPIYTVLDHRKMVNVNEQIDMPLLFDVHGKNDQTILWSAWVINWFDSLRSNHVGGVFYWDQRSHSGAGKDFLSEETTPDFFRYQTTKSYPVFTNCNIDKDPGNGNPNIGDPYGAINGYLDWDDGINDNPCDYSINVFVKDLYVGGQPDPEQYITCKTDIAFRRLQNFLPEPGAFIKWKNFDNTNTKIQNGAFIYDGNLLALKNITVNKSGNRIEFRIANCEKTGEETEFAGQEVYFIKTGNGYTAYVEANDDEEAVINVYDLAGRTLQQKKVSLFKGLNTFEITQNTPGIFLVNVKGQTFSLTRKLLF